MEKHITFALNGLEALHLLNQKSVKELLKHFFFKPISSLFLNDLQHLIQKISSQFDIIT